MRVSKQKSFTLSKHNKDRLLGPCEKIFNEQNEPHDDTKIACRAITDSINRHATPQVEWEIIHPQLPILRITAHAQPDAAAPGLAATTANTGWFGNRVGLHQKD